MNALAQPTGIGGIVLFGDVVGSRVDAAGSAAWLRTLCATLEAAYEPIERLASFGFTQGDELQGLLTPDADPFRAVLIGALHEDRRPMRWVVSVGAVVPGSGPATERTGEAFLHARADLTSAKTHRDVLSIRTGEAGADRLLGDLAPVLGEMLAELTPSQRRIAWLMLVGELRQAEVAERLGVSRATVSVAHGRGHVRSIGRLLAAARAIFGAAMLALADDAAAAARPASR
jgi:DNA-binding CsgD family transcriptional regulator